jgi:hypothetical protein
LLYKDTNMIWILFVNRFQFTCCDFIPHFLQTPQGVLVYTVQGATLFE